MATDEQYVPDEKTLLDHYEELSLTVSGDPEVAAGNRTEAEKLLARVRRDAAREALDGLYEDASQEYRIGLQGDDQERMDAAEAVLRATYEWMDNYPEETP